MHCSFARWRVGAFNATSMMLLLSLPVESARATFQGDNAG
jgi:hypothetical protein